MSGGEGEETWDCKINYPDSVNRVSPPKTTIPKTLAALPSSQYPTILLVVAGKNAVLAFALASPNGAAPDAEPEPIPMACVAIRRPRLSSGENTTAFRFEFRTENGCLPVMDDVLYRPARAASLRIGCDCNP